MLPPVDPEVASANPKFDALYRDLCSNKLNGDGTTKVDANTQQERDAFAEELHSARIAAAKSNLIKTHLRGLVFRDDELLPADLRELVAIITASLGAQLSAEDTNLLRPDIELFKENIHTITKALRRSLSQDLTSLLQIIAPESSSTSHSLDQDLLPLIRKTQSSISKSKSNLASTRVEVAQEAAHLLTLYRSAMELSIRILEQTIHGKVSRATKGKAEYLSTVAEGMSRKLQLQRNQLMSQTNSPEWEEGLRRKAEEAEQELVMLKRKVRAIKEKLEELRGEGGVEGMAREYARILGESEKVRGDIERLEERN